MVIIVTQSDHRISYSMASCITVILSLSLYIHKYIYNDSPQKPVYELIVPIFYNKKLSVAIIFSKDGVMHH